MEEEKSERSEGRIIMIAVDEGEESMHALEWALDNLLYPGGNKGESAEYDRVVVLHAENQIALSGQAVAFTPHVLEVLERRQKLTTERVLAAAKAICEQRNVNVETKMVTGDARYALCEAAEKMKVNLLVVGSRGHGAIRRAVMGSVSTECLEQTTPKSQKHDPPCPLCVGAFKPPLLSSPTDSVSVNELEMISTPVNKFPRFKISTDDGRPSSSGSKNYHQSDYMVDVSGRKWGVQMSPHRSKSFLSKSRLRKHFTLKGKSVKEIPAVELGPRGASSPLQVYPGNKSIDHFPVGCLGKDQYLNKW